MAGGDTVVVGGGAAGIAAARRLHDAGLDVLIVEAGDRLGGRARTVELAGMPLDFGCGWLHSARRNPWTGIAEADGLTVDRSPTHWRRQWRNLGYPESEQRAFEAAWQRFEDAAHAMREGPDRSLSACVATDDPFRPMLEAISGYANGAQLEAVSTHDWLAYEDASTEDNWAVREGYGTLIAGHARDVPVRLSTPVTRIDHRGPRIRVETDAGTIETARVIICVPTTVLAGGAIRFDPPLPDKQAAAAALPLGLADKVFLGVAGADLPRDGHLIGDPHSACTASYRLAPFGWPVFECFVGGDCAEGLEREGDGAASDFAIGELVRLLGTNWRSRFTPLATTRWRHEPYIQGSYSHAHVGASGQRAVLAQAIDERLFFAGEACSREDFSTAHGAYETGIAAADAVTRNIRSG